MKSRKDVSKQRIAELSNGTAESKNLVEFLVIDFEELLQSVGIKTSQKITGGVVQKMKTCGQLMKNFEKHSDHPSDTVRGWCCYAISEDSKIPLKRKFELIKTFASDEHFGVREWAWLAMRPHVASNLDWSLKYLSKWSEDKKESIRRFASEITRPRGVWCQHLDELKKNPELGLVILNSLKSDPHKYVQLSVGNWLNDASKTFPDWVRKITKKWENESPTAETLKIIRRGRRCL